MTSMKLGCAVAAIVLVASSPQPALAVPQPPIANLPVHTRPIDQMSIGEAQGHLRRVIDNNLRALERYEDEELCRLFRVFTQNEALDATEDLLNRLARQINRLDPAVGRVAARDVANYVRRVSALIRETKCPPESIFPARTGRSVGSTVPRQSAEDSVRVGLGPTWVDVPRIKGGTQFDASSGTEIPIARSEETLTGVSGGFEVTIPATEWYSFYLGARGSTFSGDASGRVAPGTTGVAQTYIFENPESGSTGVLAGATGQEVMIDSDGDMVDVAAGLTRKGVNLGGLNIRTEVGVRFRHFDVSHTINQQSLTFPDLNSVIDLSQNSNFIGPQFGVGVNTAPPDSEPGFVGGIYGFVAPGALFTSASAYQTSRCGPCGAGSPEFGVHLQRDFDDDQFAVLLGGSAEVGFRIAPNSEFILSGTIEHLTDFPFIDVPTTPTEQPIGLLDDSSTNVSVRAGFQLSFSPYNRHSILQQR